MGGTSIILLCGGAFGGLVRCSWSLLWGLGVVGGLAGCLAVWWGTLLGPEGSAARGWCGGFLSGVACWLYLFLCCLLWVVWGCVVAGVGGLLVVC